MLKNILPDPSASHRKLTTNNIQLSSNLDASAETHQDDSCHLKFILLPIVRQFDFRDHLVGCRLLQVTNNISKKKGLANCIEIKMFID